MQVDKLSDKKLKTFKPQEKRYRVYVENNPGLFLLVGVTGSITFQFRYQLNEKRREIKIGNYPATSLHDLLREYGNCVAEVKNGKDPLVLREQAKLEERKARRMEEQKPTFRKLWDEYCQNLSKSLAADKSRFHKHLKDIHDKTPDELVSLDIERIKSRLKRQKMSPQTIKHCLTLIDRIVNYGVEQEPPRCEPLSFKIKKPSFDNQVTEVLSEEQLQSLLTTIDADLKRDPFTGRAMLLALTTGMRRGALLRLKWSDIDNTTGFITLRDAKSRKTGKVHRIPLNAAAAQIFDEIPKTGSPYIFPGETKEKGEWKPRSDFNRGTRRIRKAAGLPEGFRPLHGLRHHYGSTLANSGVELYTVQKLLNHADPSTTQRYAHLSDDRLKAGAAVAEALVVRKNDNILALNGKQ